MVYTIAEALRTNFLGNSPSWYKLTIIGFLILNPIIAIYSTYVAGWVLVLEFIPSMPLLEALDAPRLDRSRLLRAASLSDARHLSVLRTTPASSG